MDLISIVVPAYNAEKNIKKCLDSISGQTYKNLDIIVINDGSTDSTEQIIQACVEEDSRIRLFSQENRGVSAARNHALSVAEGTYVGFVDADDYIESDMYEKMLNVSKESEEIDVVICNYFIGDENGSRCANVKSSEVLDCAEAMTNLFIESSYCAYLWTKLFKRNILDKYAIRFSEDIAVCEDSLFCCEYFSRIRKGRYFDEALYHYEVHPDSASHNKYNIKRYAALKACSRVAAIADTLKNKMLNQAISDFTAVICIQLIIMTFRRNKLAEKEIFKTILIELKKCRWSFLKSEWGMKYKVTFIPLKIISGMEKQ